MAELNFTYPKELTDELLTLANVDDYAPEILQAGAEVLAEAIKANTPADVKKYANNIIIDKAKKTKNGAWISNVNYKGKSKRTGIPVATVMAYFEYGTYKGERVPKYGFVRQSVEQSRDKVTQVITDAFNKAVGK